MSDPAPGGEPKKLTLKERMALKGKKTAEAFIPTEEKAPEPQQQNSNLQAQLGLPIQQAPQIPDFGLGDLSHITSTGQMSEEEYNRLAAFINFCYTNNPAMLQAFISYYPAVYQAFYDMYQQQYQASLAKNAPEAEHHEEEADEAIPEQDEEEAEYRPGGIASKEEKKKKKKKKDPKDKDAAAAQKKPVLPPPKTVLPPPQQKKYVEEHVDIQKIAETAKNSDKLLDMTKEPMNIIFIGHVDSGKSSICGKILILTGKVDKEEFRKYEQEAKEKGRTGWVLAYVMDIDEEERDKGITVDIGKANFELEKKRFTIIDCPGHKNYVPNMIAGASQADVACLVISAKTGEFEAGFEQGGQTREHAILAAYLGCSHLIVAVNKMDDNEWDIKRFNYIKERVNPFLKDICEFDVDSQVTWVPISAMQSINMDQRVPSDVCPWYTGQSLFDTLDNLPKQERIQRECLRFPVADKHADKGELTIYGKIESGSIREGMKLMVMPAKKEVTCSKIYNNEDKEIVVACTGDNIKIIVKGIDPEEMRKGNVICGLQFVCHLAFEFEAELTVMDPPANKVISNGFPAVLHLHTIQEEVEIVTVKSNKNQKKTTGLICLKRGETGKVVIKVPPADQFTNQKQAYCLEKYAEFPEMSRFTLRAESR